MTRNGCDEAADLRNLDTNPVERYIRPVSLGRKNSLFAGSDWGADRWAIVASLIKTAKLSGVEPFAWMRDSLTLMVNGYPSGRLDELLPWPSSSGPGISDA